MGILPTITNLSEVRIFLLILGTPFFMISTGLLSVNLTYRLTGLETQAYIVGERPGGKGPCAILQYKVDNIIYTKNSYRCLGDYKMTDVETVLYNPHNPASVCEKAKFQWISIFLSLGLCCCLPGDFCARANLNQYRH